MNKTQLIDTIAAKTSNSKADVTAILGEALAVIQSTVANGDEVQIIGFGTFKKNHRPARDGRNPSTKERIRIEAKDVPVFSPGAGFKAAVAAGRSVA